MTFQEELSSWFAPRKDNVVPDSPALGSTAPCLDNPRLFPNGLQSPAILTFLRHCGCPFAEKTYLTLRDTAHAHRQTEFIAVSHSSPDATRNWLESLPQAGSEPSNLRVVVDDKLEFFEAWGLGVSGYGHVLHPGALASVWRLGREEGMWNRPTESGSRWQTAGSFGVDEGGVVRWGGEAERADQEVDFEQGVKALENGAKVEEIMGEQTK